MKLSFIFFFLLIISCVYKEDKKGFIENTKSTSDKIITKNKELTQPNLTFEEIQDSLRIQLLNSKPNKNLKASILQEMYLKRLVNQVNNKIVFHIHFNLHSFDCGAPDCYSTDISFEFPASEPIVFPQKIDFNIYEHGCGIKNEIKETGTFQLAEQSSNYINYYSKKQQSNLIIIEDRKKLYYFPDTKPNAIKVDLIEKLFEGYDEINPKFTEPYQSTTMRNNDYNDFINQ